MCHFHWVSCHHFVADSAGHFKIWSLSSRQEYWGIWLETKLAPILCFPIREKFSSQLGHLMILTCCFLSLPLTCFNPPGLWIPSLNHYLTSKKWFKSGWPLMCFHSSSASLTTLMHSTLYTHPSSIILIVHDIGISGETLALAAWSISIFIPGHAMTVIILVCWCPSIWKKEGLWVIGLCQSGYNGPQ